jgi:hypothetical protein
MTTKQKPFELEFYRIPAWVVAKVAKTSPYNGVAFLVLFRLFELWYGTPLYGKNPVKLTNGYFNKLGVSAKSKLLALEVLEEAGLVEVTNNGNSAPEVTSLWLSLRK